MLHNFPGFVLPHWVLAQVGEAMADDPAIVTSDRVDRYGLFIGADGANRIPSMATEAKRPIRRTAYTTGLRMRLSPLLSAVHVALGRAEIDPGAASGTSGSTDNLSADTSFA